LASWLGHWDLFHVRMTDLITSRRRRGAIFVRRLRRCRASRALSGFVPTWRVRSSSVASVSSMLGGLRRGARRQDSRYPKQSAWKRSDLLGARMHLRHDGLRLDCMRPTAIQAFAPFVAGLRRRISADVALGQSQGCSHAPHIRRAHPRNSNQKSDVEPQREADAEGHAPTRAPGAHGPCEADSPGGLLADFELRLPGHSTNSRSRGSTCRRRRGFSRLSKTLGARPPPRRGVRLEEAPARRSGIFSFSREIAPNARGALRRPSAR
jgi:hypothetical protein